MAIALRSQANTASTTVNPAVVSEPAGVLDGDFLVMSVAILFGLTATTPPGWTLWASNASAPGQFFDYRLYTYWRVASGEPATVSIALAGGGGSPFVANMSAWTGADPAAPAGNSAVLFTSVAGTTIPTPTTTTTKVRSVVIGVCAWENLSPSPPALTADPAAAPLGPLQNQSFATFYSCGGFSEYETQVPVGATTARTITASGYQQSGSALTHTVVINPSTAAAGLAMVV